jgi:hypothetical protein
METDFPQMSLMKKMARMRPGTKHLEGLQIHVICVIRGKALLSNCSERTSPQTTSAKSKAFDRRFSALEFALTRQIAASELGELFDLRLLPGGIALQFPGEN